MKKIAGIALIIVGLLFLAVSLPSFFSKSDTVTAGDEFSSKLDSIESIHLSSTAIDWEIESYPGEELLVRLESNDELTELYTNEQGSRLTIEIKEESFRFFSFHFSNKPRRAIVQIPEKYDNELDIQSVSGDIEMTNVFDLTTIKVKSVSSDIEAAELIGTNVSIATTSGDIEIEQLKAEDSALNSISGDIHVGMMTGAVNGKTVSGDIKIGFEQENDKTILKTVSGDVELVLPSGNADVSIKTMSGEIQVDSDLREQSIQSRSISGKIGDGDYQLSVSTTSGDVRIRNS